MEKKIERMLVETFVFDSSVVSCEIVVFAGDSRGQKALSFQVVLPAHFREWNISGTP